MVIKKAWFMYEPLDEDKTLKQIRLLIDAWERGIFEGYETEDTLWNLMVEFVEQVQPVLYAFGGGLDDLDHELAFNFNLSVEKIDTEDPDYQDEDV